MTTRVYLRKLPTVQARLVDGAVPVFRRLAEALRRPQIQRRCYVSWQL